MLALYGICAALHFHGPVAPRHQDVKLQATLEAPPARAPTPATARLNTQDPTLAIPLDLPSKLKVHGPPNHASAARRASEPCRCPPMEPIVLGYICGTNALILPPPPQVRPVPPSVSVEFKKHATAMAMARRSPPVASPPARGRAGVTEWSHEYAMRRSASLSQGSQSWLPPWQRPTGLHGLSSSFYRQ